MKYWIVDVFSSKPFSGSGACVFLTNKPLRKATQERLSLEVNQTETAFISKDVDSKGHYSIQFFSPSSELKKPGHSLFAAAYVLWEELNQPKEKPIYFEFIEEIFKITQEKGIMSIILKRSHVSPTAIPDRLTKALGVSPVCIYDCKGGIIIELHSEEELRALQPDFAKLLTIEVDRIIVTSESNSGKFDYVTRVFTPRLGNNEASASLRTHCDLADFWSQQLEKKTFWAAQAGQKFGKLSISLDADTTTILGKAITVATGEFKELP